MAESYAQAIAKAKARYKEAMDDAAADVVYICRTFNKARQAVCKEIAGDGWNALDVRTRRFEKTAGRTAEEARRRRETERARVQRAEAKSALKDPDQAAKVIASLPPQVLEEVYHEARLSRAGVDTSPANRKAAKAKAHAAVAPLKQAVAKTSVALCVAALNEATDDLREALDEDALTGASYRKVEKAYNDFSEVLMEAKFKMEVDV